MFRASVLTLFPEMFPGPLGHSLAGRALHAGRWALQAVDIRDFATDRHRSVDDTPFGGGAGMVLRVDVVEAALRARYGLDPVELPGVRRVIALDPGGRLLDEALVDELAAQPALTLLSGRYEGFDERIVEHFASDRISIGRYVLAGGELAAMVVCDAVLRKQPGALGDERSALEESFSEALEGGPEYPHYTRPAEYRGWRVPEVLLSGHHARIAEWRMAKSRARAAGGGGPQPPARA